MTYIVQKFGGTSLATLELIKKAAVRVKNEVEAGHKVVVVVSAMSGTTNQLVEDVRELSTTYDRAEYDAVVSSGEQVSAGLLAISLQNLGIPARSWLGWQIPIYTSSQHGDAKIDHIETKYLINQLKEGSVAVVAGFQGVTPTGRVTTLGRGGSDTTAVALAAALQAERCDIFTDVEGVYTADPNYVANAGKLDYCFTREPSFDSRLKRTVAELSVAEYSLTGIDTRPKPSDSDAMERAAMGLPPGERRKGSMPFFRAEVNRRRTRRGSECPTNPAEA
jgi:aspartokinase